MGGAWITGAGDRLLPFEFVDIGCTLDDIATLLVIILVMLLDYGKLKESLSLSLSGNKCVFALPFAMFGNDTTREELC